jgi:hypothetical protein
MRKAYKILVGNPEVKRLHGINKCRWEDRGNRVVRCGVDTSDSGQGPVAGSYEHGNESLGSIKGGENS